MTQRSVVPAATRTQRLAAQYESKQLPFPRPPLLPVEKVGLAIGAACLLAGMIQRARGLRAGD